MPDWLTTTVLLVDPTSFPDHCRSGRDLRPTYRALIRILQNTGAPFILIGNKRAERLAEPFHLIESIPNIWIRDWGPVVGTSAVHAFRYDPDYAKGEYSPAKVRHAQQAVADLIGKPLQRVDLVLDGGNLVHNGRIAIVTEKVFRENPDLSHAQIAERIRSLGFKRVVFIPNEPGDVVGHADGMVRFSDARTLLVNDYQSVSSLRSFGQRLRDHLITGLPDLTIWPFFYRPSRQPGCDGVPSAVGCSINFLRTRRMALFPFWSRTRDFGRNDFGWDCGGTRHPDLKNVLRPEVLNLLASSRLARYGGVLNCISLAC